MTLEINLPGIERTVAEQLVQQAQQVCPYSNAVHGNVDTGYIIIE